MKFLKGRDKFLNKENKIFEKFDMSGEGSGPMGNDINWGDSLVGRLLNSISRKMQIGANTIKIGSKSRAIKAEFNAILLDSIKNASEETEVIGFVTLSQLLGDLRDSVFEGRKVKYLIIQTKNLITWVKEYKISKTSLKDGKYDISEEAKLELIKQLEDFLKFLKTFNEEDGETEFDEEEDEEKEDEGDEEGSDKDPGLVEMPKIKYSEMISILKNLKLVIDNKNNVITTAEKDADDKKTNKSINYVLSNIIKSINEFRPSDKKFTNNLLSDSKVSKWPILEISGNSIMYRKTKKLIELNESGELVVNIPKYDTTNKRYVGKSTPKILPFNKEIIVRISKYIFAQLKDIESVINSNKDFKLNEKEVAWFNANIKGKWLVMPSRNYNFYKTQIGSCDVSSRVEFLTPPVKNQIPTNINTILSKAIILDTKKEAIEYYGKKYQSEEDVITNQGKVVSIKSPTPKLPKKGEKSKVKISEPSMTTVKESFSFFSSESILEKRTELSVEEEQLNKALSKIKKQIKVLSDNGVDGEFLGDIITKAKELDISGKSVNSKAIKLFMIDIKETFNRMGDIGELFEGMAEISDIRKRQVYSDKISRFAKFSLQFEGQYMYGGLGIIGKPLETFNKLFTKLINTDFEKNEKLSNYKSFMKMNEFVKAKVDRTSTEIKEYFSREMDYDRWIIEKSDVEDIKKTAEESKNKIKEIPFGHIIEVVKLFNQAYKIYTTPVIPSGRTGGKVSNSVFREYTNMGSGNSSPDTPGSGPWRNNKMFDKFEGAILDIIKDDEYKKIFDKDTSINMGDGRKLKGGGKVLLKFINDLLDGDTKLYKKGAQKIFIEKYFGIKDGDKNPGDNKPTDGKKPVDDVEEVEIKPSERVTAKFESVKSIENKHRSIHSIKLSDDNIYYIIFIKENEDSVYLKYSKSFQNIAKYCKEDFKIVEGAIKGMNFQKSEMFFGKIDKKTFDDTQVTSFDIKSIDVSKFATKINEVELISDSFDIKEFYSLKDGGGDIIKVPSETPTSIGKENGDSSNYGGMIEILKKY